MLPPNDLLTQTDPPPISEIPPDTRPNPPSISQIPSQNHDRTPTPTPTPVHPHAHTHARPIAHTPVRTRPRATGKIASHERKGASKAPKTARITPPSAHRQAKPAQLTSREQKGEATQHQNSPKHPESYPHPLTTHASARFRPYAHRNNTPAQHQTCTRTQTQVHTLKRNTYHKHTNTTHHIPSTTRRTPPHTGEAMSPACGGARLDTTPEHQTNGARRPRRTTRAAQSRSVAIAARAPQKRSQPQTRAVRSPQPPRLSFRPARRIASCLALSDSEFGARARAACVS